jgi:asparagine synthase (glutamine-hydrolysing)
VSGLCGWFGAGAAAADASALIERMAGRIPHIPDSVSLSHATAQVGIAVVGPRSEASLNVNGDVVAAILGRPRWTGEFADIAKTYGDAAALGAAFTRLGRNLFDVIAGHTTIFAADTRRGVALAAIDRMGVERLCYAARDTAPMVFGATTDAVRGFPGVSSEILPQALFDYLYFNKTPAPETLYRDQRKLMAGEYLWHENGRTTAHSYWTMPFADPDRRDAKTLGAALQDAVRDAMAHALKGADPASTGAFLSGGLDSSTVTGMLARAGIGEAKAFTIGFDEARYDERDYARITARHFGARLFEAVVTPDDLFETIPKMVEAYDEPFANASAILVYRCAKLAREHGVSLLLAGDGGDEIFGGNERYVFQKKLGLYDNVPRWLRRFAFEPALRAMPLGNRIWLVRKARSYVDKAALPMPRRMQSTNVYDARGAETIMSAAVLAEIDPAGGLIAMARSYERPPVASTLQRMFALDIQITLADDDLRKVSTMCEAAGVAVRYPLLDDSIATFAARVPTEMMIKGFALRSFYKDAFRGFLADETLTKPKHGFGMPFDVWLGSVPRLRALVNDSLTKLKRRGFFAEAFLDEVIAGKSEDLEANRHDVHWSLMMLELWLERHVDSRGFDNSPARP